MQYRASIVRWRARAGRGRERGGARKHARDWLSSLRACVPPRVRVPTPASHLSRALPFARVRRAALCSECCRTTARSQSTVTKFNFKTDTNLSVHMVHLVDILRSAKVEYPPPVIVSKQYIWKSETFWSAFLLFLLLFMFLFFFGFRWRFSDFYLYNIELLILNDTYFVPTLEATVVLDAYHYVYKPQTWLLAF